MEPTALSDLSIHLLPAAQAWWANLTLPWKQAFNEVRLRRSNTDELGDEMLLSVYTAVNHHFAGPTAQYPNMSFELKDMSGLTGLPATEIVVVSHHRLTSVREVAQLKQLRSLFLFNNQIASLEGIESHTDLIELYVMSNQITSLEPLRNLTHLKTVYCSNNLISNLDGIGPQHADTMENFFCLPNPNLKPSTVFAFEQTNGIRCRKG